MTTKERLSLKKMDYQIKNAVKKGNIKPFDEEIYDKLRNVYHGSMPANVYLKYFKPFFSEGQCYERSFIISSIFENAKMVQGYRLDYIIHYGENSFHWWVEADGWCYDPTSLCMYKKEEYYKIFKPIISYEMDKDEIENSYYYKNMINTYPKEFLFIENLIQFEARADLEYKLTGDDGLLKELEMFYEKIHYKDAKNDEELLEFVRSMQCKNNKNL